MNSKIEFHSRPIIVSTPLFCFFKLFVLLFVLLFSLVFGLRYSSSLITDLQNLDVLYIILDLVVLALLIRIIVLVIKFDTGLKQAIYFFRFKKVLSNSTITSVDELVEATNTRHDKRDIIDKNLRELLDSEYIKGFEVNNDGEFVFPNK